MGYSASLSRPRVPLRENRGFLKVWESNRIWNYMNAIESLGRFPRYYVERYEKIIREFLTFVSIRVEVELTANLQAEDSRTAPSLSQEDDLA